MPDLVSEEISNTETRGKKGRIDVCHKADPNKWKTINISINALTKHIANGDIVLDADGDGYKKENACGKGSQNDCDDNNAATNPDAE